MNSVFEKGTFAGKVILVTGGGTGIGRCIASELAYLGAHVILCGRRTGPIEETAREINGFGSAEAVAMNIRNEDDVDEKVADMVARHGRIHGLVNNAGGQFPAPAAMIRPKGWRAVIDTNLNGTFFVTQAVYTHMKGKREGLSIVNITADMWSGFPGMSHTGAARAAVVNLTKSLAVEWGKEQVRVNAIAPGVVLSNGVNNYPAAVQETFRKSGKGTPCGRIGTESEISSAVVYLLSDAASFVTGAALRVDGGASLMKDSSVVNFGFCRGDYEMPPFHLSKQFEHEYKAKL